MCLSLGLLVIACERGVRGQLAGVGPLLSSPPCGTWRLNSSCQAWRQASLIIWAISLAQMIQAWKETHYGDFFLMNHLVIYCDKGTQACLRFRLSCSNEVFLWFLEWVFPVQFPDPPAHPCKHPHARSQKHTWLIFQASVNPVKINYHTGQLIFICLTT